MSEHSTPTRREILKGQVGAPPAPGSEEHIASLVVHVRHEKVDAVRSVLRAMENVEIHAESGGKLIITLETTSEYDIIVKMNEINLLDGVLSAALVFHHNETIPQQG